MAKKENCSWIKRKYLYLAQSYYTHKLVYGTLRGIHYCEVVMPSINTVGHRYNKMVVIEELPITLNRRVIAQCDCGVIKEVILASLRNGNTTSCGCYRRALTTENNTKHSNAHRNNPTGAYRSWQALNQRVKVDPNYSHVIVCDRWLGDSGFVNFLNDMGDRPDNHSIERKDNTKGYEPNNCRWATKLEQAQNTRHTKHITILGETHSISEWCRIKNISYALVKARRKRGISLEDAIMTPIDKTKQGALRK